MSKPVSPITYKAPTCQTCLVEVKRSIVELETDGRIVKWLCYSCHGRVAYFELPREPFLAFDSSIFAPREGNFRDWLLHHAALAAKNEALA